MPNAVFSNSSNALKHLTNIAYSDASAVLGEAKKLYWGSTLIWSKSTWVANISGNALLVAFTPTQNMTVKSFSMVLSGNTNFNYVSGIWTLSGTTLTPVTNACTVSTTGLTITTGPTFDAKTAYIHTRTYDDTSGYPTLVAGTTYYFHLGDRYQSYYYLGGLYNAPGYFYDWAASATATATYTVNAFGGIGMIIVPKT